MRAVQLLLLENDRFEDISMNRPIGRALGLAALLAITVSGCDSDLPTVPTPTGEQITETFTGTVAKAGQSTHPFSATMQGPVTATLNSLAPDSSIVVGMTLGTWAYEACSIVVSNPTAKVNSVVIGTATAPVNLCFALYDVGSVTEPTTYSVTVTHY